MSVTCGITQELSGLMAAKELTVNDKTTGQQVRSNDLLGGNAATHESRRLNFVLAPLVQMMGIRGLSWVDREAIANAMLATIEHHKSMEAERLMFEQKSAAQANNEVSGGFRDGYKFSSNPATFGANL